MAKTGLTAVPVNFRLTAPEVQFIAMVSAVLAEPAFLPIIERICSEGIPEGRFVLIGGPRPGSTEYEALIARASADEPDVVVEADDAWCLMCASSTKGKPKGPIRNHCNMAMLALMMSVELGLGRADDVLWHYSRPATRS